MEQEYYCQGCQASHLAALWYVRPVGQKTSSAKAGQTPGGTQREYLCGQKHGRLATNERSVWILREDAP